jgi:hypothetical protein
VLRVRPAIRAEEEMETMADVVAELTQVAEDLSTVLPHRFDVITALPDGTSIPPEALSEDHTIGLYGDVIPRKMRENADGFREIEVADLLPQLALERTTTGATVQWFLECPALRNVRFRAERLQYLEEGWWGVTGEVKYPAATVLGLLHVVKARYGLARIYLNTELPLPLWIRSTPLNESNPGVQAAIQARGEGRVLLTNIHTECPMDFARQFAAAARHYYRLG